MPARTANLRRLLVELEPRIPAVAEEVTRRTEELEEVRVLRDPSFLQVAHESNLANISAGLRMLSSGERLPREAPTGVAEAARQAATAGVSLATLLRAYRVAHAVCWRHWMAATDELDLPAPERAELLELGSEFLFQFVDHVATLATDEYSREREGVVRGLAQRRLRLVRDLIDGVASDTAELDYDLGMEHVAVIAWGGDPRPWLRELGARLDRRMLSVAAEEDMVWTWLGGRSALDPAQLRRLEPPDGVCVAVGNQHAGLGGFRDSHQEALEGRRVALRLGTRLTHYDDVALESLALRDERYARAFVARELAPLAGGSERARRLRETLRAYFASGQNAAAAAAALGVHDQTVSNRLRTIEEQLGRPVQSRRAELEVALRLEVFLRNNESAPR